MADASEDILSTTNPTSSGASSPSSLHPTSSTTTNIDVAEDDSAPDFRFLLSPSIATATSSSASHQKLPTRGAKDFDLHGTRLQQSVLEASRQAMHDVLREERVHARGTVERAVWDEEKKGVWCLGDGLGKLTMGVGVVRVRREAVDDDDNDDDEDDGEKKVGDGGIGGDEIEKTKDDEKRLNQKKKKKRKGLSSLFLLPEEALWLLDRGSLDLRWPAGPGEDEFGGSPMSLQAAHAMLIGKEGDGGLTLEKFTVYQYLKRAGYVVMRAETNWQNVPEASDLELSEQKTGNIIWSFWRSLTWGGSREESEESKQQRQRAGPLVKPGLYRDYGKSQILGGRLCSLTVLSDSIYRLVTMIPYHSPLKTQSLKPPSSDLTENYPDITYHVYKPSTNFKKTKPGSPDFYISVINVRQTVIPTEPELEHLLRQTPFHPWQASNSNVYQKAKVGIRNVILAVVDQGIISFINVSDAAFGLNALWQREKKKPNSRGGGVTRGGFRGKGRGRR
jgi:tRNA-splicing endonuclease subunit Sen54